jgi:hypothetical protein
VLGKVLGPKTEETRDLRRVYKEVLGEVLGPKTEITRD